MTLDTRFAITSPVLKPCEVFDHCNRLLAHASGWDVNAIVSESGPSGWHNRIGQGLCALMDVQYGPDGPLKRDCYCEEDREPDASPDWKCSGCRDPEAFVEASFDTAYSYLGPNGERCSDLHAALIDALGTWCDARGYTWSWQNEYTGEWHEGREGLADFGSCGERAMDWFDNLALPAIQAHTGAAS